LEQNSTSQNLEEIPEAPNTREISYSDTIDKATLKEMLK
jgi:hypothetical protein